MTDQLPLPPHSRRVFLGAGFSLALLLAGCGSDSKLPPTGTELADSTPPPDPTAATSEAAAPPTSSATGTTSAEVGSTVASEPATTAAADALAAVPGPPAAGGIQGGKIVVGFLNEGNSWDPALGYTETSWDAICNLTYAPLYSYGEGEVPLPNAAADLPTVSADGLVYTIPLRPGVTFSNGREVVAEDYRYTWTRLLDPKLESWASSYIYSIDGASDVFDGKAAELRGVKVIDDMTIEVTLGQPDITFLYALTQPFMAPVPKEEVEALGEAWGTETAVGNGPYKQVSYDSTARTARFERYPGYFWQGLPYVDEVEFQWGLDANVQLLKLQRGEVDVLYSGFTPQQLQRVAASDELKPFLFQWPLFASRWINLHPRVPALADPRVRKALNLGANRDQLSRTTGAEATTWGAPFPEPFLGSARTFQPYGYDPDAARELLAQAGAENLKFTLIVVEDPEPQLGQILQQQWKDIGVDVKLEQMALDASYDVTEKGQADAWFSTYYAIYPTPIDLVSQYYETDGSVNYTGYSNPDVDRLTAEARATVDATARDALLAQVEQALGDDAASVFLQTVNWLMGVNPERLKNFHYSGVYGAYYDRLWVES